MKYFILIAFISIVFPAYAQNTASTQGEAISVLEKVSDKLNSLTTISYNLKRTLNYPSENYHHISEWTCYFHFDPTNTIAGFEYQVHDSLSNDFFNGTEKFELNKTTKAIEIDNHPQKKDINWFCRKHGVVYKVLMNGQKLAEEYGVNLFPTVILIDQEGKVLYSGGFDQSDIEKRIERALSFSKL